MAAPYQDVVLDAPEYIARYPIRYGVMAEIIGTLAAEKAARKWQQTENGAINIDTNENLEEYVARTMLDPNKAHYLEAAEEVASAVKAWIGVDGQPPTLADQGARVLQIGETAARNEAMQYGTTLGSTKPGTVPGEKVVTENSATTAGTKNPWSASFVGSDADRLSRMTDIMKRGGSFARDMAKSAGTTVTKPLPRKVKG